MALVDMETGFCGFFRFEAMGLLEKPERGVSFKMVCC